MAENSSIEWTDHTFNPWQGCTKVRGQISFLTTFKVCELRLAGKLLQTY